jgi:hypothetical protein
MWLIKNSLLSKSVWITAIGPKGSPGEGGVEWDAGDGTWLRAPPGTFDSMEE